LLELFFSSRKSCFCPASFGLQLIFLSLLLLQQGLQVCTTMPTSVFGYSVTASHPQEIGINIQKLCLLLFLSPDVRVPYRGRVAYIQALLSVLCHLDLAFCCRAGLSAIVLGINRYTHPQQTGNVLTLVGQLHFCHKLNSISREVFSYLIHSL
jgi:hypothetical protein